MVFTDRRNKKRSRFSTGKEKSFEKDLILKLHFKKAIYDTPVNRGEAPMTAGGGNLVSAILNRKGAISPVESCDY